MRINLDEDERIIASLPKVWENKVGFVGFFSKSKEGILVLTSRKIVFVPKYVPITPKERERFYGGNEAKVTIMERYSESDLDEDIEEHTNTLILPLGYVVDVESTNIRNVNFLRIKCRDSGRTKTYDFGIAKSVTNYPIRQPLLFENLNWDQWVRLIKSYL
jgi:hypothetical protein